MADTKKDEKNKGGGGKLGWLGFVFGLAIASAFFGATMILVFVGMLPTFVALATDRTLQKTGAIAIGVLNFAGTLPFIIGLWNEGGNMADAVKLLVQPTTLFTAYGAAGIGWLIYTYVPKVVATYVVLRAEAGIAARRAMQKKLLDRWGPRVTSDKPISQLEKED